MDFVSSSLALLGLRDAPEKGKSPETRLQNANDARKLLSSLVQEDTTRALERAVVKGMVDGNPPYPDAERRAQGRSWECNLNFMEGESIMDSSGVPYYNIFARADTYAQTRTNYQPDHAEHETWCAEISLRFHNMLKRWPEFDWHMQQCSYWMRMHGIGPAFFDRDGDWRFRSLESGNLLVPRGSPSSIDHRVPFIIVRTPYRIVELWERIQDEKAAEAAGWNVPAVRNAIKYGMKGLVSVSDWYSQPWEYYARILRNNDLTASFTDGDLVNCCAVFVQEFAKEGQRHGKISKFIVTEFRVGGEGDEVTNMEQLNKDQLDKDNANFLFADPNRYDSYQDALVVFFQNSGDGTFHSVRGLAQKAFKHVEVSNRLKCQAVNRAFIDSSVVLQSPTERNRKRMELAVWGTVVRLPAGAEIRQTVVQGGTAGVLQVDRMLTNHLANNIGMFQQRSMSREDGKGEQPTATQVQHQVAKESTLSQGQITLFFQYLDALYSQIFSRAADPSTSDEEAKRFQRECLEFGVPKEALADMAYVRASRDSGYGSPQMGLIKMEQGVKLLPLLPEDGKQNWLKHAVTQVYGPEFTKRFVPDLHIPDDQDWQAAVENQMISGGRLPVIQGEQDDVIHLTSHLHDAQQTLAPVASSLSQAGAQDAGALQTANAYADLMGQHVEGHIARLQRDPVRKKEAKLFEDQFMQLAQFSKQLLRALRQAHRQAQVEQEQQDQATSLSALDQAKVESVRTGTALAAAKTKSQIANQRLKTVQGMQLKDAKQAHGMRLEAHKAASVPVPDELTTTA